MTNNAQTSDNMLTIEVAYAKPEKQLILTLTVAAGTTIEQAIIQSGMLEQFDDIDLKQNKVGIWNRTQKLTETVRDGDRIEIYRPLIADPKEVRKRRAERAKLEGRADKVTGGRVSELRKQRKSEQ